MNEVRESYQSSALAVCTEKVMDRYYRHVLHQIPLVNVYEMVMSEVELPLLEKTMEYAEGDVKIAANILGMSMAALTKRLKKYHIQ